MKLIMAAVLAAFVLAGPAAAGSPPAGAGVSSQETDYGALLNRLYAVGCATGGVVGTAAGFAILPYVSGYLFSFALTGCAVGLMAGPLGMLVQDKVFGDNTIERYIHDRYPDLAAQ